MTDTPSQGSPFWRFSLAFYRMPNVAEACIALQEEAGVDVNLLLYLLWQAQQGRQFPVSDVAGLEAQIAAWREATVIPLRQIRRALKSPPGLVAAASSEAFRNRIKAVELEAERLQQEAMYALSAPVSQPEEPANAARANIAAYAAMRGAEFPKPAVATLMAAFANTPAAAGA